MNNNWTMIWHQAITQSFLNGKAFGKNKTVVFTIPAPVSGEQVRIRFSNRFGSMPYEIGALRVYTGTQSGTVTLGGKQSFQIPVGGVTYSDPFNISVKQGEEIQIRLYYTNIILDNNMIEEGANLLPGDQTQNPGNEPLRKPMLAKLLGAYNGIPAVEAVEVVAEKAASTIVAFGDSITAQSRWTKPLAARLANAYPGEFTLVNSGISGNCLLYEVGGIFGPVFGAMGTKRFEQDVLAIPNLRVVIFALGVNDVSYLNAQTAGQINLEAFQKAVTDMVNKLHAQGVRVVMQTITPRLGVARTMGKYDRNMEALRLQLNNWLRSAGIFDYLFDAEAVVREERPDGFYYKGGLHMGDHLHPNAKGGELLANAFDLEKLTGKGE